MDEKEIVIATDMDAVDSESIVVFSKPYSFEGKTYTEVDLSGLEMLTAEDMIAAGKYMTSKKSVSVAPETSVEYACFMASRATDLPIEFFMHLPMKDAAKIKNHFVNFIYGEE